MEEEPKLSDVLEAVKKGFDGVDEKFEAQDKKIDALDKKVDAGFENLGRKIDRVDGKVNTLVNVLLEKEVITGEDKQRIHF